MFFYGLGANKEKSVSKQLFFKVRLRRELCTYQNKN